MQVGLRNSIEQSYKKHTLQNYDTGPNTVRHWEVRNRLGGISVPVGTPYVPRPSKLGPIEGESAPAKAPAAPPPTSKLPYAPCAPWTPRARRASRVAKTFCAETC